jgi:hypothetical protein
MSTYSYCIFMYFHRANWHSSAILTEVFPCFFLRCNTNARVKPAKTGHGPHSSKIVVLYVLFVLCRSVYCFCVYVYCTTATGWLPNCSQIYIKYKDRFGEILPVAVIEDHKKERGLVPSQTEIRIPPPPQSILLQGLSTHTKQFRQSEGDSA